MKNQVILALVLTACAPGSTDDPEVARWERQARQVTITRDDWGIPHIQARTDADAVFGLMYAQAEDDFNRIETNYLTAMGRLAEAEGETAIFRDLRMRLFIDPDSLRAMYAASPDWLKALMDAFADGLNYYLHTHPEVRPRVLTRFEPWMALSFSEGSIGGDIERISIPNLRAFYDSTPRPAVIAAGPVADPEPRGSNGIAIAPANTAAGRTLFLINPHTSFFFRAEAKVESDEGLNAYGAITWGQFFIYQGFNDRLGWMHTSSGVDNIDEFAETVTGGGATYRYGSEDRPLLRQTVVIPFRTDTGMARREFTVYRSHRGPIVRMQDGKWISTRLMHNPVTALIQSFTRTKARNLAEFRQVLDLHTNSSNNTVYADADGNIAYFHANFVPRRDPRFDWTRPVDGSDPATEWGEPHPVDESPLVLNPGTGWLYNTNNWPWSAAGPDSPHRDSFPAYMETFSENARGLHAVRVLENRKDFTLDGLLAAAYDSYLPAFATLLPPLMASWDRARPGSPLKERVAEQVALLRAWDLRWGVESVPTTLAVFWGEAIEARVAAAATRAQLTATRYAIERATDTERLQALADISDTLVAHFGAWRTPWGEINRFQRLTGDIVHPFDDAAPSLPVGFTSARWGSLASFGARPQPGTRKWYGTSGNSFVAVVEFGDSVRARAVSAGGQSGNPASPHFRDQAERYVTGNLREVYFYASQLRGHIAREYRPGR